MKIKDVLQRDPASNPLINQGQARISDSRNQRAMDELRGELSTFVCEGQYAEGIQKIVRSFLDNVGKTSQRGAWVSGFFGSGKSHLLKMLCHLWQDTPFPDGSTARSLVPSIPEELRDLLRELDTAGKRAGGLLAAAGALPSGTTDNVRLTILGILLRAAGLPEQYPQARFCLWLHSQGFFDKVKAAVEAAGKTFERELNNLYVSGPIARAVIACDSNFATGEAEAKQLLKAQFTAQPTDISTGDFLRITKEALKLVGKGGRLPCTLVILDEAQQYIGDSQQRASLITEVTEAISKQLDSQVMVVAAGQSALTEIPLLGYLLDRYTIRVPLSDAEVETVTRKVLLQKDPTKVADVRALLDRHAGEVSRQLQGTRIGESVEDRAVLVDDYPLLPVRRRFWENCFRQIDAAGTSSQLRSQLRIIHDAVGKLSDHEIGAVVPGDELFEALAPEMVNTGVLLREINERIIQVGKTDGALARRLCGLVFLINKLKREGGADIGVRATKDHLADLLIDNLTRDNGKLRAEVEVLLKKLADQGTLMLVEDEYRLQTREGSEWDREFRVRQAKLNNNDGAIQFRRDQLLYAAIGKIIPNQIVQGAAKVSRSFHIHRDQTPPAVDGMAVPLWIRDGWSCAEKDMVEAARAGGIDSPILFVFIPRQSAEDLRRLIVDADATRQTLDVRGNPTTAEGQEARQSMESRCARAGAERERLIGEIVANAKVFKGGGSEVMLASFNERIRSATDAALISLFPRFKEADAAATAWEAVIKRVRDGADHPFQPVGHTDATERHPVCQQVKTTIGAGKTGTDIRKALRGSPFGWPQDAMDAALLALHRAQHVSAALNGAAVALGQLDQSKIPKTEFRVEQDTLSVQDRLVLRKLFQALNIGCKSGEETAKAAEFLMALIALARSAGGDPPCPAAPPVTEIEDIQRQVGNAQLLAIKAKAANWEQRITEWTGLRDNIAARLPGWGLVERMARHVEAASSRFNTRPEAASTLIQVQAIRDQRMLLEPSDPANTVRLALGSLLRDAVQKAQAAHQRTYDEAMATLAGNDAWTRIGKTDQDGILSGVGLVPPSKPDVSTDQALANHLDAKPLSSVQAEIDAIAGRVVRAIEQAAKLLEPKVQPVHLERTTLRSAEDVEAWLARTRATLTAAVADGPVLVA